MQIHDLQQGTPEWHAHRAAHFNASDAPAMMGCSPYKTRSQLLHELCSGIVPEVDAETQSRFDAGHRAEALARPLAEKIIGEDLFPCVGTEGRYSASFDGLTMAEDTAFEHKSLNADLRAAITDGACGHQLPLHYRVQMEQQLLVSGALRVLFMASKWAADGTLVEEQHTWYEADAELRAEIINGWAQFAIDLATYVPPQAQAPKAVGATPETLPALRIEVTGMVTASNLDAFKSHALEVFKGINRELSTDQHFADAEATVKWCASVEERLAAAKQHALSQTESIDALFRAIDDVGAEARRVRLELDKLVKARKEAIRGEIAEAAHARYAARLAELNADLSGIVRLGLPAALRAEVGEAMKGKRTVDTLRDAADTAVARALTEVQALADRYRANHATLAEHAHLVPDFATAGAKAPEDFAALLQLRLHQHADAARQKAEREAAAKAEAERIAAERVAQQQAEAQRLAAAPAPVVQPTADTPPAAVKQSLTTAQAADEPATLKLGTLCERLGLTLTADALAGLGFQAHAERGAKLYRESQFPAICDALIAHIARQRQQYAHRAAATA